MLTYFLCFYASSGDFAFDPVKFVVYLLFVVFGAHTGSMQARALCVGVCARVCVVCVFVCACFV